MAEHGGSEGGGAVRQLLAIFGFEVEDHELKKGENSLVSFAEKLKNTASAFAAAFAVHEIGEFVESQAKALHSVERTASALGISTERVQQLQFAAKSMGEDGDVLVGMLGRLQVAQSKAAAGSDGMAGTFHELGVKTKDASGKFKSADEILLDVADGIKNLKDPAKQAAAATQLFGRSGRELLPFLKEGREEAEELFKTYRELGGGYTKEAMEAGKAFEKQQAKLDLTEKSLKNTISIALLPVMTKLSQWAAGAIKWFNDLAKNSNVFQAALVALGAVGTLFAIKMAIAFWPITAAALAVGALILAIDDLITWLQGGDSIIGEQIDKIFGKGSSTDAIKEVKRIWKEIGDEINQATKWLRDHWDTIKEVAKYIGWIHPAGLATHGIKAFIDYGKELKDKRDAKENVGPDGIPMVTSENARQVKDAIENENSGSWLNRILGGGHGSSQKTIPASGNVSIDMSGDVNISVDASGMSGRELASDLEQRMDKHHKRKLAAAKATLQRAASQ